VLKGSFLKSVLFWRDIPHWARPSSFTKFYLIKYFKIVFCWRFRQFLKQNIGLLFLRFVSRWENTKEKRRSCKGEMIRMELRKFFEKADAH
jgi:hypothetical protein